MGTTKSPFGQVAGQDVDLYTLSNDNGIVVKITNYGGTITSIVVPDRKGRSADVVCGFDTIDSYFSDDYKGNSPYFGCLVGRYAARIKDGKFSVGGKDYQVATNDGPNHLHGGIKGYDKCIWGGEIADEGGDSIVSMSLTSPDGDENYPGTLVVKVEYRLTDDNELRIRYLATTDADTPVSLTNHTYFNLSGFQDNVLDHTFQLSSDHYLEPDVTNVPVGQETAVAGTACDFNEPRRIGDSFEELPLGFEHYYVFRKDPAILEKVAELSEPGSGRTLEVYSSEPGTLFYTGRYTSDDLKREDGSQFGQFRALCVETSKYPNGPNIEGAPRSVLKAGDQYDETTIYKFSWA